MEWAIGVEPTLTQICNLPLGRPALPTMWITRRLNEEVCLPVRSRRTCASSNKNPLTFTGPSGYYHLRLWSKWVGPGSTARRIALRWKWWRWRESNSRANESLLCALLRLFGNSMPTSIWWLRLTSKPLQFVFSTCRIAVCLCHIPVFSYLREFSVRERWASARRSGLGCESESAVFDVIVVYLFASWCRGLMLHVLAHSILRQKSKPVHPHIIDCQKVRLLRQRLLPDSHLELPSELRIRTILVPPCKSPLPHHMIVNKVSLFH